MNCKDCDKHEVCKRIDYELEYHNKSINEAESELAEKCRLFKDKAENKEIEKLQAFKSYFDELYGTGLEVANWHENGDLEPFDCFYDSAIEEMEGEG